MKRQILIGSVIILFIIGTFATAATRNVPIPYGTIQQAINAANPGDEVIIAPGTYTGSGNRDLDFGGKAITVRGSDPNDPNIIAATIIDCQNAARAFYFHNSETLSSKVSGLTIKNGYSTSFGGAIEFETASATIEKCVFSDSSAYDGGAIDCWSASPLIINCIFNNNTAIYGGAAIEAYLSSPDIVSCLFTNNQAGNVGGAIKAESSSPTIIYCTMAGNSDSASSGAVYADALSFAGITNCISWDNTGDFDGLGISVDHTCSQTGSYSGSGNISADPQFAKGQLSDYYGDYYLRQSSCQLTPHSPCVNTGTGILGTYGLSTYTTRTDGFPDTTPVDMGYHFPGTTAVTVTLTTSVVDDPNFFPLHVGHGTISPHPGGTYYEFNEVILTATPDANYVFAEWTGIDFNDPNLDANSLTQIITMIGDRTITVRFEPCTQHILTVVVIGGVGGSVTPSSGPQCEGILALTAVPDPGYQVKQWTGTFEEDGSTVNNVLMDQNRTVYIEFVSNTVTLTARVIGGNGTVFPMRGNYPLGSVVFLTADPDPLYKVKQWTGTDNDANTTVHNRITMDDHKQVTVEFEQFDGYYLTTHVLNGQVPYGVTGSISVDGQPGRTDTTLYGPYDDGQVINLYAEPNSLPPGYHIKAWYGTDHSDPNLRNNTVTINSQHAYVMVEFEPNEPNGMPVGTIDVRDVNNITYGPNYPTIQQAINAAVHPNDQVVVANGTYSGPNNVDLHFIGIPITVRSEFGPEYTIIDCNGSSIDPHRAFVFPSPMIIQDGEPNEKLLEDPNFFVKGFTIINGHADNGGAMIFEANSAPTIDNCWFISNYATSGGGALYFRNINPDIENDVEPNLPRITGCKITTNNSEIHGGGIYCDNASPWIINTEFTHNWAGLGGGGGSGGGVYCKNESAPKFINCLVMHSYSADQGGAFYLWESPADINLCTIMRNSSNFINTERSDGWVWGAVGGIAYRGENSDDVIISHCIIGRSDWWGTWGDLWSRGDDLYNCSATYSCIENNDGGDGNIDDNPLFVTGRLGDYYLSQTRAGQGADSPCIDQAGEYTLLDIQAVYGIRYDDPDHQYLQRWSTNSTGNHRDDQHADMGYHFPLNTGPTVTNRLEVSIIDGGFGHNGRVDVLVFDFVDNQSVTHLRRIGFVDEDSPMPVPFYIEPGHQVYLYAVPDPNYRVKQWLGTDDDSSFSIYNTVTMTSNRSASVEFEIIHISTLSVPGEYQYIQDAIDAARDGDTVAVSPGTYPGGTYHDNPNFIWHIDELVEDPHHPQGYIIERHHVMLPVNGPGYFVLGKNITIRSNTPDDPDVVAATIIDCNNENGGGFHLYGTGAGSCLLNGFTIKNSEWWPENFHYGDGDSAGENGWPGQPLAELISWWDHSLMDTSAISIFGNHTVANCIIEDCTMRGVRGGHGYPGGTDQVGGSGGDGDAVTGAGIYIGRGEPNIVNCTIDNCLLIAGNGGNGATGGTHATGGDGGVPGQAYGAGIYIGGYYYGFYSGYINVSRPTFRNCTIKNCRAVGGQGGNGGDAGSNDGFYGGYGGLTIDDQGQGHPWDYSARGAGVYCAASTEATFIDCNFIDNYTEGSISGIGGIGNPTNVRQEPLEHYSMPTFGAGIFCDANSSTVFIRCNIQGNTTDFVGDDYSGYGGGIAIEDTNSVKIIDCNFAGNLSTVGGAIYALRAGDIFDINDSNLAGNESYIGGALASFKSLVLDMKNCTIKGNLASADAGPVPDANDANTPIEPEGLLFGSGGGLYIFTTDANITDCVITENTCSGSGAGVYMAGHPETLLPYGYAAPTLKNCLITNNTAGRDGGGVSCNVDLLAYISNCTIADNRVLAKEGYGGGLYCSNDSDTTVIDSIIWNNVGDNGSQITVKVANEFDPNRSPLTITYSDIGPAYDPVADPNIDSNTPDYFIYSTFDTSVDHSEDGSYGLDGWVGSDEIDRIIHYSYPDDINSTNSWAFIHTVTIPDGADPHAHPNNPYSTGDIAPRTFTLERIFDLGVDVVPGHGDGFYVDAENNAIYLGAYTAGIRKYVFDPIADNPVDGGPTGNYVYDSNIAPPVPDEAGWTQSFAYDPDNDIWYAGSISWEETGRQVWKYDGSQGPGGIWNLAFTYNGGTHHDGMEFLNGYLLLVDYQGDYVKQFTPDGTLTNIYYHEPLDHELEGMGWGALEHFWVGSHGWAVGNRITEFGGGALQRMTKEPTEPVYIDNGCSIDWWDANSQSWDFAGSHNINEDPNFVSGYFLSQFAAGQPYESNCVDGGSDLASILGMDLYTTRSDGIFDDPNSRVDMGYHYPLPTETLVIQIVDANGLPLDPNDPNLPGSIDPPPGTHKYYLNQVVRLEVNIPDPNYRPAWNGTDNDSTHDTNNTVTMTSDKTVTVSFELTPKYTLTVTTTGGPGTSDPNSGVFFAGTQISLFPLPEPGYRVKAWYKDSVLVSQNEVYKFVINSDTAITLELEPKHTFHVPSQFNTINTALTARDPDGRLTIRRGDTVVLSRKTYNEVNLNFAGRSFTITSEQPDDPECVADTIIDCGLYGRAFIFAGGEDANAIIDGITIINGDAVNHYTYPYWPSTSQLGTIPAADGENGLGGAIRSLGAASPVIDNCVIRDCVAGGRYGGQGINQGGPQGWNGPAGDGGDGGTGYGGAMYFAAGSNPTVRNTQIINCSAIGGNAGRGGDVVLNVDDPNAFDDGGDGGEGSSAYGGAMYFETNCKPKIKNCQILYGESLGGQGGRGGHVNLSAGDGGNAGKGGEAYSGAIYFEADCNAVVENCTISRCRSNQGLGNIGGNPGTDSGIGGNGAVNGTLSWAGAIYCDPNCTVKATDTTFNNNTADTSGQKDWPGGSRGGARAGLTAESKTSSYAGGNYYSVGCKTEFERCIFRDNSIVSDGRVNTDSDGGAEYYLADCRAKFTDCSFLDNAAGTGSYADGGGLAFLSGCVIDINTCSFVGNSANGFYGSGGGIYFDANGLVTIKNSFFYNNTAMFGAGLYWYGSDSNVEIIDCTIGENIATNHGGGIYFSNGAPVIKDCYIVNNTAKGTFVTSYENLYGGGGGLFVSTSDAVIENCSIIGNSTLGSGGGLYLSGGTSSPMVKNCLITDNSALLDGGGIVSYWNVTPTIQNCTIANNTAFDAGNNLHGRGGGMACSYESSTKLIDSILWGNTATNGGQIFVGSYYDPNLIQRPAELDVSFCDVEGWQDANSPAWIDPNAVRVEPNRILIWDFNSIIDDDPLFVQGYYLSWADPNQEIITPNSPNSPNNPNSPCVDIGSGDVYDPNIALADYTTRTDGANDVNIVDLGFHYPTGQYQLTVTVIDGLGTVEPNAGTFNAGTVLTIQANPGLGYYVDSWYDSSGNLISTGNTLEVLMNSDKQLYIEFRARNNFHVPAQYHTIGQALSATDPDTGEYIIKDGDKIIVSAQVYNETNLNFAGRSITISSEHPDDPNCVAATIINCQGNGRAFVFSGGEGLDTVLNGLTIINGDAVGHYTTPASPHPGEPGGSGENAYGGAIRSTGPASPLIVNCIIRDCVAGGRYGGQGRDVDDRNAGDGGEGGNGYGGAMYFVTGSNPTIRNTQIINCQAIGGNGDRGGDVLNGEGAGGDAGKGGEAYAGAIYFEPGCSPKIQNCLISGCSSTQGLGARGGDARGDGYPGGNAAVNGTQSWAGAVYYGIYCRVAVDDTVFKNNTANTVVPTYDYRGGYGDPDGQSSTSYTSSYAGANYYNSGCQSSFVASGFNGNNVVSDNRVNTDGDGGGEYYLANCSAGYTDCNFVDNVIGGSANGDGAALAFLSGCVIDVNNSVFTGNTATGFYGSGGGIYWDSEAFATISSSDFNDNEAEFGGGLYWYGENSIVVITDCNFTDNTADHGAGLYFSDGAPIILRCNISGNRARGRYVYLMGQDLYGGGGGMFCWTSDVLIQDCRITGNSASGSGGGIYLGGAPGSPTIKNCLIADNSAIRDGGGVVGYWSCSPVISNCTIVNNKVIGVTGKGGGLACSYASTVKVIDSIIWDNRGSDGSQIAMGSGDEFFPQPSKLDISFSDIGPVHDPNQIYDEFDIPGPPDANSTQGEGAIVVESETIYSQFDAGEEMVKIIVGLREPTELRAKTDWSSPSSVAALRAEIANRRDAVISSMSSTEFIVRHRYKNQAGFSGDVSPDGLNKLINNPLVSHIEPVRLCRRMLAQAIPLANALDTRQFYGGEGIAIAIVDGGVDYNHPMLGDGNFPNIKVIGGYDTAMDDNNPTPFGDDAHGTCCAGIAAGDLGTVGDYIGGVAPSAKIYALKASYDGLEGWFFSDDLIMAWNWCITHQYDDPNNPIMVVSNSWGEYYLPFNDAAAADAYSPAMTVAAEIMTSMGMTIVAASGNDGYAGEGISWPGAMSKVISVGAVFDVNDHVTAYSNTAELLDILAPGDPIYTTDIVGPNGYDPNDYVPNFNGTSASCPFVAGAVASLQSAAYQKLGYYLPPDTVREILTSTGDPVTDTKVNITKPRLNLGGAISIFTYGPPIYIEQGCILNDWLAPDTNSYDEWDFATWDPNRYNISEEPLFVLDYFLSQIAAGQDINSPCVDIGSADANDPNIGMDTYTTRTDGVVDDANVDMGYHYRQGPAQYQLTIRVVDANGDVLDANDPNILYGYVEPNSGIFYDNQVVQLQAYPDPNYRVEKWSGTDNDNIQGSYNTVTMTEDKIVTVEFDLTPYYTLTINVIGHGSYTALPAPEEGTYEGGTQVTLTAVPAAGYYFDGWYDANDTLLSGNYQFIVAVDSNKVITLKLRPPRTINVPGEYSSIQQAFGAAGDGDKILLATGTYRTSIGYYVWNKEITITSVNPDDPCVVANTVIEMDAGPGGGVGSGFTFYNVGPNTVLDGVTIRGFNFKVPDGADGNPDKDRYWGTDGRSVSGGGIDCYFNASPTIKNCIIENCSIRGGNGGNGSNGDEDHPYGGFGGDPGYAYGGGLSCMFDSHPTMVNCTFKNCSVTGGNGGNGGNGNNEEPYGWGGFAGGWYYYYGYDYYRRYTGRGGAVYVGSYCYPVFTRCKFVGNSSYGGVSGVCGQDGFSGLRYEPSIHWQIDNFGGAVYCDTNSTPVFTDCEFTGNTADTSRPVNNDDPHVSFGGAVAFDNQSTPRFIGCTFNGNLAAVGGAMYWNKSETTIFDSDFVNNTAYHGGALYCADSNYALIMDCNIADNNAVAPAPDPNGPSDATIRGQGGGIYCDTSPLRILNCRISGNDANSSGAGLYFTGASDALINNCLIINNEALRDGGGISNNWYSNLAISNCTIVDNLVMNENYTGHGGGLFCGYDSNSAVINTIIWDNFADYGPQTALGSGDEAYPMPSRLTVSYSDIKNGEAGIWLDSGCILQWDDVSNLTGISWDDPLFVPGDIGDHYLSQIDAYDPCDPNSPEQTEDSPCVDSGIGTIELPCGYYKYTTRTDNEKDANEIDIGYHYYRMGLFAEGDFDFSGQIDWNDLIMFMDNWLGECDLPCWCEGTDINRDGIVNWSDYAILTGNAVSGDKQPPTPDPMTWEIVPHATGETNHQIAMTATEAVDNSALPVFYYFECITNNSFDSGWLSEPNYIATGLADANEYGFRVRAVDHNWNTTQWSLIAYAVSGEDVTPPTPNPMTWAQMPVSGGATSVFMSATIATDNFGGIVEYYFENVAGGGNDSGWQIDPSYTDIGLDPNTTYSYRVKARDESSNETNWSQVESATPGLDLTPPSPDPMTWDIEPAGNGLDSITMTATTAIDSFGGIVEYYFDCVGGDGHLSDWSAERTYTDTGLNSAIESSYRVKARDQFGNETEWSEIASATPGVDEAPPVPDPMAWDIEPNGLTDSSIYMKAVNAVDASGSDVQYYFNCFSGGGHDSGWQDDPNYLDAGLDPNTEYGYRVKASDDSGNETDWSIVRYATTLDMTPPSPDPMTWETVPYTVSSNSISMTASVATDISGVEYYFECVTDSFFDRLWYEDRTYIATGLVPDANYTFRVKARDKSDNQNETDWSDPCSATTWSIDVNAPEPQPIIDPNIGAIEWYDGSLCHHNITTSTATDASGVVEYYFYCSYRSSGDYFDGKWITSEVWDTPVSAYSKLSWMWKVKARDAYGNETDWSPWVNVYSGEDPNSGGGI